MGEDKKRSLLKSAIWRIMGMVILGLVTFFYTKNWITTGWVTFLHHFVFLWIFYIHERFYLHVDYTGWTRHIIKAITYETILGNFVLAIITLIIIGDVQQMTKITLTYIGIKHVIYVTNELCWQRLKFWRS